MIEYNYNLKSLNTFRVDSICDTYFKFKNFEELDQFVSNNENKIFPNLILGGGSNLLLTSDFRGLVLHPVNNDVYVIEKFSDQVIVRAHSGLEWDEFVAHCVKNNWHGPENLTLIPGNVGASPVQNIGAYGVEVSEIIESVNCYDLVNKKMLTLSNIECEFTYRSSIFKKRPELVVLSVDFRFNTSRLGVFFKSKSKSFVKSLVSQSSKLIYLSLKSFRIGSSTNWKLKMNFEHVRDVLALEILPIFVKRKVVKFIRQKTMPDPKKIGNVGCFFKSPIVSNVELQEIKLKDCSIGYYNYIDGYIKISAGDLIKSCKWNGKKIGDVSVEKNRPLIILNHGEATGKEILNFSKSIQHDVYNKFDIKIEPEVVIIGE